MVLEMEPTSPMEEPSKEASAGSMTLASGKEDSIAFLVNWFPQMRKYFLMKSVNKQFFMNTPYAYSLVL